MSSTVAGPGPQREGTGWAVDRRDQPRWYGFSAGAFYRLDANKIINRMLCWFAGAHSDIRSSEVAWAVVATAGLGQGRPARCPSLPTGQAGQPSA
ncbi:hypothetical protein [Streptomyces acidicola]|uniref:hypothetical protein n=1 Tax=Streptomyces acidicola TaxID=2596892 RepID=UPI00382DC2D6